jgi:AsmA protein
MRTGKILSYGVGGVIALTALVLLSVWLLVNPNHYKTKIAAAVKDTTGRDLVLQGDIKLSVFPWVALELGPATLGNPAGFSSQPFLSFQHAAVRAKLLPLIHERLEIVRVEIDGLDVRLQKNAEGKGNWEGLDRARAQTPSESGADSGGNPLEALAGLRLSHARLTYQKLTLDNVNVETAPFADGVVPISIGFDINRGVATEHATVNGKVDFSSPAAKRYRLAALMLVGQADLEGDNRPVRWNMSAPSLEIDLIAQTLAAPGFALAVAGAQLNGDLQGTKILDEPNVAGSVTLAPLVVREFMPRWGFTAPTTRDPRAFSQVSGSTTFIYGGNALRFQKVQLTFDDTHLQGSFSVENFAAPALKFDLSADQIDVDRYLAPEGQSPEPARPVAQSGEPPSKPMDAEGTLVVGVLHMSRLNLANLRLTLAAKEGLTHVYPLRAQVDSGLYSGDITFDRRGSVPMLSVDEHLSGVDMGKLLASSGKSVHL